MAIKDIQYPVEYLQEMLQLRKDINEGKRCWADAVGIRAKYNLPQVAMKTIKGGAFLLDEYLTMGWINPPVGTKIPQSTTSLNADGSRGSEKVIELSEDELNSKEALLKAHGFNPVNWELISARNSKWQMGDGSGGLKNLYSSKITVKPTETGIDVDELMKKFEKFKPSHKRIAFRSEPKNPKYLIINLFDLHIGRASYEAQTGLKYNLEIAEKEIMQNVEKYIDHYTGKSIKKIVFCVGQDLMNSAANGYTSSGKHQQDNCAAFMEIFDKTTEIIIDAIDRLTSLAPVDVIIVQRNHYRFEELVFGRLLEAYFRNDTLVTVDATPRYRKYVKLGNTLVGFTHGSDEKERLGSLMQTEAKMGWGLTENHIWITGHLHHLAVKEANGIETWTIPSLTAADAWTAKTGFTSAKRRSCSFLIDDIDGMEEVFFANLN